MESLLKRVWHNKKQILEGIKNSVFKEENIENIAAERMQVCNSCPLIDREGSKCAIPGTAPCCGACGCKLSFKVRSLSSECAHPDKPRWNAVLSEADEDKFYQDINYNPDKES